MMRASLEMPGQTGETSNPPVDVSIKRLDAKKWPLMRRAEHQFRLDAQHEKYSSELTRVRRRNRLALASISQQEERLKRISSLLRDANSDAEGESDNGHVQLKDDRQDCSVTRLMPCDEDGADTVTTATAGEEKVDSRDLRSIAPTASCCDETAVRGDTERGRPESAGTSRTCGLQPIKDFTIVDVAHDSFTVRWEVDDNIKPTIVDYEVCYTRPSGDDDGQHEQVTLRLSRWCLGEPVPDGQFVIGQLETCAEHRGISMRCLSSSRGWSDFCAPIECVTTLSKGEWIERDDELFPYLFDICHVDDEYQTRRGQFMYRISYIKESIKRLEQVRESIPAKQLSLATDMKKTEKRLHALTDEIERVSKWARGGAKDSMRSYSRLISVLQQETAVTKVGARTSEVSGEHCARQSGHNSTSQGIRDLCGRDREESKCPKRAQGGPAPVRQAPRNIGEVLRSVAALSRRRVFEKVWPKLCALISVEERPMLSGRNLDSAVRGVGDRLLRSAERFVDQSVVATGKLMAELHDFTRDNCAVREGSAPLNLLPTEDRESVAKASLLFSSGLSESALRLLSDLLSKMASPSYFDGMEQSAAIHLHAEVNGKVAEVHLRLGSVEVAIVYFGRQLELANEMSLRCQRAAAFVGLGKCYIEKGDFKYAESFLEESLDVIADDARKIEVYSNLQICCESLGRQQKAAELEHKIKQMNMSSWDTSRPNVEKARRDLLAMQQRLVDVTNEEAKLTTLEVKSAKLVKLQCRLKDKKEEIDDIAHTLQELTALSHELESGIQELEREIKNATMSKKKRVMSRLIQGTSQDVRTSELLLRHREKLKLVRSQLDDCMADVFDHEMKLHNAKDDLRSLEEDIQLEQSPLMVRVLNRREYGNMSMDTNVATGHGDGDDYIVSSEGSAVYVHSLISGQLTNVLLGNERQCGSACVVTALCYQGNRVYTGTRNHLVVSWDLSKLDVPAFVGKGHEAAVTSISGDDKRVISGGADKLILIWNAVSGNLLYRVPGHSRGIHHIRVGPDWFVSASFGNIFVWDVVSGDGLGVVNQVDCKSRLSLDSGDATALHYNKLELVCGDSIGKVSTMWIESGEIVQSSQVHEGKITCLEVSSTWAITAGVDMTMGTTCGHQANSLTDVRQSSGPQIGTSSV
ncbi:hypothetical protein THAOC_27752 [Thalassiosira oceanica]|uniref:Uncharacterized protein n=1 Tax=Thalassiosira oceanica TaxID=159749 RepID=K0S1W5_THAOC|nr:hypothetical protein THAOC_27752 [Thalassiosira oceanica]|eukprot:EJK52917.1 hypothetical protein THAOC_27752 [Thalassiosira oceanica]